MSNIHGDFIWYELLTSDADAAGQFYADVVGWISRPGDQPGMDYRFFHSDPAMGKDSGVGGYMTITPGMATGGARPGWISYVAVDDVDAACATAKANGGAVSMGPMDLEGVGRMAMIADPEGLPIYVMRGASDEPSHSFAKHAPRVGHGAWNELASADQRAAWAYYGALFGWAKGGDMDMGPLGKYEFIDNQGMIGAIMPTMPDLPEPGWTTYFRVPDIDRAAEAVTEGGGAILQPPIEIPGGDFSLVAADPQGARFGLVGARA
jgi:uncharacterized protein